MTPLQQGESLTQKPTETLTIPLPVAPSKRMPVPGHPGGMPRLRRGKRRLIMLCLVIVLVLCGFAVAAYSAPTIVDPLIARVLPAQPGAVAWNGQDPITILAMGIDQRTTEATRSDTMMVIRIDPKSHQIHMLSVPRDLWAPIPGSSTQKINASYALGGPHLAELAVENFLGIPIDYSAVVRFTGFKKLVDAIGGVTINVATAIDDPTYPADVGNGFMPIHIKAGVQHMNGTVALEYVRSRHTDPLGDIGRNERQQQVLVAVEKQLASPGTLLRLPGIVSAIGDTVTTDFPSNSLTELAVLLARARGQVDHQALTSQGGYLTQSWSSDGQWIWLPNTQAVKALAQRMFPNPAMVAEHATVQVENGTTTTGLAGTFAGVLQSCGFTISATTDADKNTYTQAQVIENTDASPAPVSAHEIAVMAHTTVTLHSMGKTAPQITVILGSANAAPQ